MGTSVCEKPATAASASKNQPSVSFSWSTYFCGFCAFLYTVFLLMIACDDGMWFTSVRPSYGPAKKAPSGFGPSNSSEGNSTTDWSYTNSSESNSTIDWNPSNPSEIVVITDFQQFSTYVNFFQVLVTSAIAFQCATFLLSYIWIKRWSELSLVLMAFFHGLFGVCLVMFIFVNGWMKFHYCIKAQLDIVSGMSWFYRLVNSIGITCTVTSSVIALTFLHLIGESKLNALAAAKAASKTNAASAQSQPRVVGGSTQSQSTGYGSIQTQAKVHGPTRTQAKTEISVEIHGFGASIYREAKAAASTKTQAKAHGSTQTQNQAKTPVSVQTPGFAASTYKQAKAAASTREQAKVTASTQEQAKVAASTQSQSKVADPIQTQPMTSTSTQREDIAVGGSTQSQDTTTAMPPSKVNKRKGLHPQRWERS